ncbi:hypothetical protein E2562_037080 [Oryza meyeriana var. granulata]|uniref:F-box domain-containing protein n=1 Tax=Oryza meyeriana var. granulata TaxID=110450 RepID=A0A6G1CLC5_9ORYZ|nr:hypothetical protein E2562_037080 [Oryza meyeriana var. granulata]
MADSPRRRMPQGTAAAESPPDALVSLPLDVLDNILSRLHIYEVVRTSVLSRAWRRRWEALPSVDLARSHGISASDVDALLLRRSAPLRTFRLVARDSTWFVDALDDWLLYLSRNGVQALDLSFPELYFRLHSSLFSCRELTSLVLNCCRLPPAPSEFAGFPNLKTLRLKDVDVPKHGGKVLAALIAASPLLGDLELMAVKLIGDGPHEEGQSAESDNEYPRTSPDAQAIFMGRESESLLNECSAIMDTSTEDTVDEVGTQTTGNGLSNDVAHPRRWQRLDIESVAQLEEIEVTIKLKEQLHQMNYISWMIQRQGFVAKIKLEAVSTSSIATARIICRHQISEHSVRRFL